MALTRIKTDQITDGEVKSADLDTDITLTGDLNVTDITMTGELNGPATFYIDPAPHDPDTDGATNGLVVIRGDLQVDGTTTTVNSTTMDVADLNITLASGAANAAAADGAGLTVDGASATILYDGTNDEWDFNKDIHVDTILTDTGIVHAGDTDTYIKFLSDRIYSDVGGNRILDAQAGDVKINGPDGSAGIAIDTGGYVGIGGVTNPTRNLHVETTAAIPLRIEGENAAAISYSEFVNASTSAVGNGVGLEFRALTTTQERQLFYIRSAWTDNTDGTRESLTKFFTSGSGVQKNPLNLLGSKVGIGTDDPQSHIEIEQTGSTVFDATDTSGQAGDGATLAIQNLSDTNDTFSQILFRNRNASKAVSRIASITNGTGTDLAFVVENQGSAPSEVMRIVKSGKVGIGETVPQTALHVKSSFGSQVRIQETGGTYWDLSGGGRFDIEDNAGNVKISLAQSGNPLIAPITVNTSNEIGVNKVASGYALDVNGDINVGSAYYTEQVRHSIRPTLNLDFANSKKLDSRITFYRDSIATYYDSKGVLRYANVNEPRFDHDPATGESKGLLIEEARNFLNTNTVTINGGYWGFSNSTASVKQAVAPDGTYSADGIRANTVNDSHGIYKVFTTSANTYYTLTAYFKRGANRYVQIAWYYNEAAGNTNYPIAYFDLDDGTFSHTSGINRGTTMTDVGNGWYRCSVTALSDATPGTSYFYANSATASGTAAYVGTNAIDTYYWGLQIETGPFPTSYVPSDTRFTSRSSEATYYDETGILRTAPANSPRYGYKYDGRKWVETGLILEDAGTNLFPEYTTTNKYRTTIVNNTSEVKSPDDTNSAMKLTPTDATAFNYTVFSTGNNSLNGSTVCGSIYAKAGTNRYLWMSLANTSGTPSGEPNCTFDLQTGTISRAGDIDSATIEPVADGWYRCSVGHGIDGTPTVNQFVISVANTNSNRASDDYLYVAFPQIESGQFAPTSYIYWDGSGTTTRSADVVSSTAYTRAIDVAKINNITNEDWYNTREGSIYTDFYPIGVSDAVVVGVGDGTSRGFRAPWITGDTQLRIGTWSGSAYSALHYYNSVTVASSHKSALSFSYEDSTFISSLDGSTAAVTSSWPGVETDATTIWIGGETDSNRPYSGHIEKVSIYNEALSTAELQALTENN